MVVRDRHAPARILETKPLTRFIDYTFEPFSGRILLNRPVPSLDENLNPVSLRITYEVDQGGRKYWVYGANGQFQPTEGTDIGAAWVKDRNPLAPFEMGSANVGATLGENGWVRAEIARTRSSADSVSGRRYNLTPNQTSAEVAGNAWRAEAGYEGDKGAIGAWYGQSDIGFNNPASSFAGGQRQAGVEARRVLRDAVAHSQDTMGGTATTTDATTVSTDAPAAKEESSHQVGVAVYTRGHFVTDRQTDAERTQIQAGVQLDLSPRVRVEVGANRVDEQAGNTSQNGLVTASNLTAPYGIGIVTRASAAACTAAATPRWTPSAARRSTTPAPAGAPAMAAAWARVWPACRWNTPPLNWACRSWPPTAGASAPRWSRT